MADQATQTPPVAAISAKAVTLNGLDLALVAASAIIPLALQVLGLVPNPIVAAVAAGLAALWAVCKTFLASKHLGTRADVEKAVAGVLAAVEKATGKDIFKPDVESAIEFGVAAAAEQAGLTTPDAPK